MRDITISDADIQKSVIRELGRDARVSPADVGVQVHEAIVTLTGAVDSWSKARAAEEAAHRAHGVQDVANDLVVRPPGAASRSDTDLARAVRQALELDVMVPDWNVQSTVSQGRVTLRGTVRYGKQRAHAQRAVEDITGVTRVLNRILVRPPRRAGSAPPTT